MHRAKCIVRIVCQLGCTQCADGSGVCTQCQSGFSQNAADRTKCNPPQQVTSSGTVCPGRSFSNGNTCQPCDSTCQTCKGGTSNDCTLCASSFYTLNGSCVAANSDGICTGTNLIADNNKHECDSTSVQLQCSLQQHTHVRARLPRKVYIVQDS